MRATSTFAFVTLAVATAALTACTVNSSDGDGDDGGTVEPGSCVSTNESDVAQCDVDCDTAVVGDGDIYECTVSCVDDTDCSGSRICLELTDGTGACLEDCSSDGACSGAGDACDGELFVCLPGGGVDTDDDVCVVDTVSDADSCDEDCDAILEGETAYKCTVGCDPDAQDCGDSGLYCLALEDGTGACVEDCAGSVTCSDSGDTCDATYDVCLPGGPVSDDTCETENVSDPSTCDVDCDTYVEGTEGVYQCTISCDADLQDCGDGYTCAILSDATSVCVYDCADGASCPSDFICDEVDEVCVPDAVSQ